VIVEASPGATVRVSMVEAFNPTANGKLIGDDKISVKNLVAARLQAQYPDFPANNAKNWQHKTVTIPSSGTIDVSNLFNYNAITARNPIAFCAVVINSSSGDPVSRTTAPIRLIFSATA
jgi:hypothetical protein